MTKYTSSHEWIEEPLAAHSNVPMRMGVTAFAQQELGEIVYVELPKIGSEVIAGQEIAVLESTKAAADVYSPVAGKIMEVNEALREKPELINHSPEQEGWLVKISLSNPKELDLLFDATVYQELLKA